MNVQKRNTALDITRIIAFLSVVSIHFFMNIDYYSYPMLGGRMLLMTVMRTPFTVCVPLFIMLTGYLMNKKTVSGKYYLGIVKTLVIYVLSSIACIIYKTVALDYDYTIVKIVSDILDFTGANYSWYVEMYIGLFLLVPFINLMYNGLKSRNGKLALIITLCALTALPSVANIYNFTVSGWWKTPYLSTTYQKFVPDFWVGIYPLTYYFLGAYLREFPIKMKKLPNLLLFAAASVLIGLFNYYRSWGGYFSWGAYTDWGSGLTLVLSVLAFAFLTERNTANSPLWSKNLLAYISDLCFGAYLTSYVSDRIVYGHLNTVVPEVLDRIYYAVPAVVASALLALIMSAVLNLLYSAAESGIKKLTRIKKGKKHPIENMSSPKTDSYEENSTLTYEEITK